MEKMFNGMFGKIEHGMCRLSMNGGIAVKTSGGYKSYNIKSKKLTNCNNFVFDAGDEWFWVIPTNKVSVGDIILAPGKNGRVPKCVIKCDNDIITVINYEDSTIENILPERHVFLGNTYFYGKIVSMFGSNLIGNKKGTNDIMKYMMMSEMMKGNGSGMGGMSAMLPFMMMSGGTGLGDMFSNMFNFEDADDTEEVEEVTEEE